MNLLAIETSSSACSVALGLNGDVTAAHVVEPRAHTRILMPMISELLAGAKLDITDLDAVVLGNGPGSFIGMRIGASVAQGICFAADLKIIPVSSLAAVAAEAMSDREVERVAVAQDARMNELYLGVYQRSETGIPVVDGEEVICSVDSVKLGDSPWHVAGDGWNRYPESLQSAGGDVLGQVPVVVPNAQFLIEIAQAAPDAAVLPEQLAPSYLRQKVAEKPARTAQ